MKITKRQLKRLINEEFSRINEGRELVALKLKDFNFPDHVYYARRGWGGKWKIRVKVDGKDITNSDDLEGATIYKRKFGSAREAKIALADVIHSEKNESFTHRIRRLIRDQMILEGPDAPTKYPEGVKAIFKRLGKDESQLGVAKLRYGIRQLTRDAATVNARNDAIKKGLTPVGGCQGFHDRPNNVYYCVVNTK